MLPSAIAATFSTSRTIGAREHIGVQLPIGRLVVWTFGMPGRITRRDGRHATDSTLCALDVVARVVNAIVTRRREHVHPLRIRRGHEIYDYVAACERQMAAKRKHQRENLSAATKREENSFEPGHGDPFEPTSEARLTRAAAVDPRELSDPRSPNENANRALVARKDGRKLRRTTVYLPNEVASRLLVYCAEHDVDISRVVTEAVRRLIGT